ncbi:MAG: hypothetical protein GF329_07780 [Candidatus Lokiarchaeota archaeon]|nr:hypothetical protein [Candidatus Lokiarchaeota archaeon]
MSLSVVNLGYFLYGVFIFLSLKFIDRFEYFEKANLFLRKVSRAWNFIFGMGIILVSINGIFSIIEVYSMTSVIDYRNILPTILMLISSIIFLSDSFKKPTANYLISLGMGFAIAFIGFLISLIISLIGPENIFGHHILFINYILLIPVLLSILIGIAVALAVYYLYLKKKTIKWNNILWDISGCWKVINNQFFLLIICIIVFFEIFFQFHSTSIISLFFQLP